MPKNIHKGVLDKVKGSWSIPLQPGGHDPRISKRILFTVAQLVTVFLGFTIRNRSNPARKHTIKGMPHTGECAQDISNLFHSEWSPRPNIPVCKTRWGGFVDLNLFSARFNFPNCIYKRPCSFSYLLIWHASVIFLFNII